MNAEPLLRVRDLARTYRRSGAAPVAALRGVSLELNRGETLAVVGLSGAGKSTLARCIAGLETPDSGTITLAGDVQMIFQQPAASLNPRFTAAEAVGEPLRIRGVRDRAARVAQLLETVGLPQSAAGKRTQEFSGGERQRLAIARALALAPALLILDESFAGCDLSIQAQIAALLAELQQRKGLSYILITHDLTLATRLAGVIAVMSEGRIVELAPPAEILARPAHPATRALMEATAALSAGGAR